jgi:hypothetical protein
VGLTITAKALLPSGRNECGNQLLTQTSRVGLRITHNQRITHPNHSSSTALPIATISSLEGRSFRVLPRSCPACCQSSNVAHPLGFFGSSGSMPFCLPQTALGEYSVLFHVWNTFPPEEARMPDPGRRAPQSFETDIL